MATTPAKGARSAARKPTLGQLEDERDQLRQQLGAALHERDEVLEQLAKTEAGRSLVTRIAEAMNEAGEVVKDRVNAQQGYKFASAESILKAVRGPLFARNIVLLAHLAGVRHEDAKTTTGKNIKRTTVLVDFTFRDGLSDETLVVENWEGVGEDSGDKGIGKAYTSAIKTFIRTQWLLPTEHDDPEREGTPAPPPLPEWAAPLGPAVAAEQMRKALEPIAGAQNIEKLLEVTMRTTGGAVPRIVIDFAHIVRAAHDRNRETPPPPTDAAQVAQDVARQAVAGEEPQADPEAAAAEQRARLTMDPPGSIPNPLEVMSLAGEELPIVPLQIKALREAGTGCICGDPLSGPFNPECPIVGHGSLPF